MVHNRRSFVRLAALASATAPWTLASLPAAEAAPAAPPAPRPGTGPVDIPPPNAYSPGTLSCGNSQGLLAGFWTDSAYSVLGFVYRDGTVRTLPDSSQPNAVSETGVVVGDLVTHYDRQAFRWVAGTHQPLGYLGGTQTIGGYSSTAAAVSTTGVIVGASTTDSGEEHAYRWADNRMQDLGTLGGRQSRAVAVNRSGLIAGTSMTAAGAPHGFVWSDRVMHDLGTLGGETSTVVAANDAGQIVGYSDTADGHPHAFLWEHGRMTDLGLLPGDVATMAVAITRAGTVLVNSSGAANRAFLWRAGQRTPVELPGGTLTATGINDQGYVCGNGQRAGTTDSHAFRWYRGQFTDLGTLGGSTSSANAITAGTLVLGSASLADSTPPHAVYWPAPAH